MEYELMLKRFRTERGLSQEDLAALSGYSQTYISALERGKKSPTLRNIIHLCKILKICPHRMIVYNNPCTKDCLIHCNQ